MRFSAPARAVAVACSRIVSGALRGYFLGYALRAGLCTYTGRCVGRTNVPYGVRYGLRRRHRGRAAIAVAVALCPAGARRVVPARRALRSVPGAASAALSLTVPRRGAPAASPRGRIARAVRPAAAPARLRAPVSMRSHAAAALVSKRAPGRAFRARSASNTCCSTIDSTPCAACDTCSTTPSLYARLPLSSPPFGCVRTRADTVLGSIRRSKHKTAASGGTIQACSF